MEGQPLQARVGQWDESGVATEGKTACLCGVPPLTSSCTVSLTLRDPLLSFARRMLLPASVGWRSWDSSFFVEITRNPLSVFWSQSTSGKQPVSLQGAPHCPQIFVMCGLLEYQALIWRRVPSKAT